MNIYQKALSQVVENYGSELIQNKHYKESTERLYTIIEEIMNFLPEKEIQEYFDMLETAMSELDYVSAYFYFNKGLKDGIKISSNNKSNPLNNDFPYYDDERKARLNTNVNKIDINN